MGAIIQTERIGKKYILNHQRQSYYALRDVMADTAKRWGNKILHPFTIHLSPFTDYSHEEFWALKEVSFEINEGDRVGIIGRNGAGKSTLLKIISRITELTTGRVKIQGRVASLLEVGTGFHPELTGRENIYLNGAILGMTKAEIKRKFDEIVDFAEVEKFLDTPVKRYSSGMYVRLAFAVAAHLEPEILVVDEVLAVGDAQFQKKCLGKMEDVGRAGRTILFVSHNMNAVEQLCSRVILLGNGRVINNSSEVRGVIKDYLFGHIGDVGMTEWRNESNAFENPWFKPLRFSIHDESGKNEGNVFRNNADIRVRIEGEIKDLDPGLQIGYALFSEEGNLLYWSCQTDTMQEEWPALSRGRCVLTSSLPKRLLNEGTYRLELLVALYYKQWLCQPGTNTPALSITIQGGLSDSPYWMVKRPGTLAPVLDWNKAK